MKSNFMVFTVQGYKIEMFCQPAIHAPKSRQNPDENRI